ncbi:MAG: Rpn family recombination-promoting nuclease/putative transposase [Clostridia bacterium]|nr:Rpn family recombination-promoting nuclease/putative transposase [Clostridia bacterium]
MKVTNDILFQYIFGKIGHEQITKGFLEDILGIQISSLSLDTNKRLIGEADLKRGESYKKLDKTIAILIIEENLNETKEIEEYHTIWKLRENRYHNIVLTNNLEIHIIELAKFKTNKEKPQLADNWIKFIKGEEIDMQKMNMEEKVRKELIEAMEELDKLRGDPELIERYERKADYLRDQLSFLEDAKETGIEEGIKRARIEAKKKQEKIVINMYKRQIGIEEICEITSLTKKEVKQIIEKATLISA